MQLSDFHFNLPAELVARYPLIERSSSRLLCLNGQTGAVLHRQFSEMTAWLEPGDLLVFNDTKVIPARLLGRKSTGGQVEVLVERILDDERLLAQLRVSKPPKIGDQLWFEERICLQVNSRHQHFYELVYQPPDNSATAPNILAMIESIGQIPLPPYIEREAEESDKERYQTIYAKHKGSVAAPTAGLHFDVPLLERLQAQQVDMGYLTLHIGAGTFVPVRVNNITEHQMHTEYLEVSEKLCEKINIAKAKGKRVIAVGTTSLRALETASQSGKIEPYHGETNIFIYPGYHFRCADALITNFHLPSSTLLMLVCAFGNYNHVMNAYKEAVATAYRFYSYGDAMWVSRSQSNI